MRCGTTYFRNGDGMALMEPVPDCKREDPVDNVEAQYLLREQVRRLCHNMAVGLWATSVNATLLAFVLRTDISRKHLLVWLTLVYLTVGLRYFQLYRCRLDAMSSPEIGDWNKRFIILAALSGNLWGLAGIFLFPEGSVAHQAFLSFVLGGMAAGAAAAYAASMPAFLAFTLPLLLPFAVRLLFVGDEPHIAMGAMALLFTGFIVFMGKEIHATTLASLKLRFENKGYMEYLALAKERAEQLNNELTAEINERKRGEEELRKHRGHLQELVDEQTAALSSANELLKQEVAEHKLSEELLRQSQGFITRIIDSVDDGFIVVDRDYRIISANQASCNQVNRSLAQVIGSYCHEVTHNSATPCPQEDCPIAKTFATGLPQTALHTHKGQEGKILNVAIKSFPLKDSSGNILSVIEMLSNVTEKLKVEEQMRNSQKLESLGILAGGIAHDFNNLLGGMFGYIDLARERAQKGDVNDVAKHLAKALAAFERAKHLTQQLITFAKGGAPILQTQSLVEHVQKTIQFALSGAKVAPTFLISDDVWPCSFDQHQVAQVIDNLVINACQAMPLGGNLEVGIMNIPACAAPPVLPPKKYVRLSIRDQGSGIDPLHVPHIFDPFFTTKKEGSGLGLTTSYSIVKKHGGHIELASTSDQGTTFHVYLPAALDEIPVVLADQPTRHKAKGRMLLMDDDVFILEILSLWLKGIGYEDLVTAKEGNEAILLLRKALLEGKPFFAAILDLTIPGGRGGKDIVRDLIDIDPALKVIASSGYSEDPVISDPTAYGFTDRLIKPYRKDELVRVLASISGARP